MSWSTQSGEKCSGLSGDGSSRVVVTCSTVLPRHPGPGGVAKLAGLRELAAMGLFSPYSFVQSCRTLVGFNLSLLPDRTGELQRAAKELFGLWTAGRIRPILGPRFLFERLPDAHRALAGRGTQGKVVITVG